MHVTCSSSESLKSPPIPSLIQFIYPPTSCCGQTFFDSLIVGYADNHTLLKIIPDKSDHVIAASQLLTVLN